jgi:hypothetical protein
MTWDEENRLKQVNDSGSMRGKFLYAPDGERTQKQTVAGGTFYLKTTKDPWNIMTQRDRSKGQVRAENAKPYKSQIERILKAHGPAAESKRK